MSELFSIEKPEPIIPRDREDEAIQAAARKKAPSSIRAETLLTGGAIPGGMGDMMRRAAMGA